MNNQLAQKKIPGFVGLFVLLIGIGVTVWLAQTQTNLFQHASPSETPKNIRITNISDTSFTLTYQTDTTFIGTMTVGTGSDTQTILDDRDQKTGTPRPYSLHSITAKNLQPSTTYTFSILSGSTTFLNNGQKFSVTTASKLTENPSSIHPLAGKIVASTGNAPDEAIVYATTSNGQTLSTLTNESGLYILPLNTLRTKDLASLVPLTATSILQLLVVGTQDTAEATISVDGSNPVPAITLGEKYDFTLSSTPVASSSAVGGFPAFGLDESLKATPQILNPATPNQGFTDAQPLFKGTALPNEEVSITIHSDAAITKTVTADANGNWSFRPSTPLSPGQHTILISTKTKSGIIQTIQRSFTVYAAGSQVGESATPSATLTPKPTATPTPTFKPTATPTPLPKATITPLPTATPTPVTVAQNVATITSKPQQKLPPTGSNATVVVGITGIVTTLVGMMIFILTRGAL